MDWLRGLFGRDASPNPEDYERVRCDRCDGTGHAPIRYDVELNCYAPIGHDDVDFNYPIPCGNCHGKGYMIVKKDPEELHDTTPQGAAAACHAPSTTSQSSGAMRQDEQSAPETCDAPSAPSAPTAPEGIDDII